MHQDHEDSSSQKYLSLSSHLNLKIKIFYHVITKYRHNEMKYLRNMLGILNQPYYLAF